jgi:hypothetical protein
MRLSVAPVGLRDIFARYDASRQDRLQFWHLPGVLIKSSPQL